MMPYLTTKLAVPSLSGPTIIRSRLLKDLPDLSTGETRPVVVVSAPAGYGKTTLVVHWVRQVLLAEAPPYPVVWLSLDADDNDPVRFTGYLAVGLSPKVTSVSQEQLALATTPQGPPPKVVLGTLINAISELDHQLVIVLDDYHLITEAAIHTLVAHLISHKPPQLCLVLISREVPPLPMGRLRAQGQLRQVDARALRFTPDEVADYLGTAMGLPLSDVTVNILSQRTGGWIAGLQLAALAFRDAGADASLQGLLSRDSGSVAEFFQQEILAQQPERIRTFLLHTAILDELQPDLCSAVVQGVAARECLDFLTQRHLFTTPVDDTGGRFRFHPLFQEWLRMELRQRHAALLPILHRRAATWYFANAAPQLAIEHSFAAGDFEAVAAWLETNGDQMWTQAEMKLLCQWTEALPYAMRCIRPKLCLLYAWASLMSGQPDRAEAWIEIAGGLLTGSPAPVLQGLYHVVQGAIKQRRNPSVAIAHYLDAIELLPQTLLTWRAATLMGLGFARMRLGETAGAHYAFAFAIPVVRASGNGYGAVYAAYYAGLMLLFDLDLPRAKLAFENAITIATADEQLAPLLVSWGKLGLGEVSREQNNLSIATQYALDAVAIGRQRENHETIGTGLLLLARIEFALQHFAQASELLYQAELHARDGYLAPLIASIFYWQARVFIQQGQLRAAQDIVEVLRQQPIGHYAPAVRMADLLHSRVMMAGDQFSLATDALNTLFPLLESGPKQLSYEANTLMALCSAKTGNILTAVAALKNVLVIGQALGWIRFFLDEGEAITMVLRQAGQRRGLASYAEHLLANVAQPHPPVERIGQALIEALSDTETAVLRLLAAGMSNQHIAEQRVISLNTVKWHLKNIYGKLGVRNRTAALAKARSLDLL